MKRNLMFTAALFYAICTMAQKSEYPSYNSFWIYNDMSYKSEKDREKIVNAKVIGYNETFQNKKKSYLWQTVTYDNNGNCTSVILNDSKGKLHSESIFTYNDSNKVVSKIYKNKKGEVKNKITCTYDKLGHIAEMTLFVKGKEKSRTVTTYDSSRYLECYYFKNGNKEFSRKWVYTYYPDKSKKSSVIYDADGKVLYTWNYECKAEGQLASKHKDTTAICKNEEIDKDNNKIITSRRFNEKGKPYKIVYVTNKEDKMLKYETYNENGTLSTAYKYNPVNSNFSEIVYYNSKGKETYKIVYVWDENNNQTGYSSFKKGKPSYKFESVFNTLNFPVTTTYYRDGEEKKSTYVFDYKFSN